ncbi:MAG TPA: glycosyltransferase, partial [Phycisphaerae bacterium]|nr:glycosyltransferase [Phycisphaerae bacterium]
NAIFHVWSYSLLELAAHAAELCGAKVLLSLPALPLEKKPQKYLPWDLGRFRAGLTLPTHTARQTLVEMHADPKHIFVLPPAAEIISDRLERRTRMRASLGISSATAVLATAGPLYRMGPQKMAAWALGILRNVMSDLKLIYPGKGPDEKNIRRFAATTGYIHDIFYTGERFDYIDAMCAADVVLCCNQQDVGINGAAAALAASCATIVSDTPDLQDFCADKKDAVLTCRAGDPAAVASEILKLLDDEQLRDTLSQRAANTMHGNSPDAVRGTLENIYAGLK